MPNCSPQPKVIKPIPLPTPVTYKQRRARTGLHRKCQCCGEMKFREQFRDEFSKKKSVGYLICEECLASGRFHAQLREKDKERREQCKNKQKAKLAGDPKVSTDLSWECQISSCKKKIDHDATFNLDLGNKMFIVCRACASKYKDDFEGKEQNVKLVSEEMNWFRNQD